MYRAWILVSVLPLSLTSGCVREEIPLEPAATPLFSFQLRNPVRIMESGSYHGTSLFFEIDLKGDLSPQWVNTQEELQLQLQFIAPKIDRHREIYELGRLHRVVLSNSRWQVGAHRYPRRDRSRLYVFKQVPGDFSFTFRGQQVLVKSPRPWIPSIYYYYEEETLGPDPARGAGPRGRPARRRVTLEVVQVGLARIELDPERNRWLVNGAPFEPTRGSPLKLIGSVRFAPSVD